MGLSLQPHPLFYRGFGEGYVPSKAKQNIEGESEE